MVSRPVQPSYSAPEMLGPFNKENEASCSRASPVRDPAFRMASLLAPRSSTRQHHRCKTSCPWFISYHCACSSWQADLCCAAVWDMQGWTLKITVLSYPVEGGRCRLQAPHKLTRNPQCYIAELLKGGGDSMGCALSTGGC